jgi:GNAT superfamily N-acetyltransferase
MRWRSCSRVAVAHFRAGQRVPARNINPVSHTRLPRYARGKIGAIERDRGVFEFPDTRAQDLPDKPQHVYSVRFAARELWGEQASPQDSVYIDGFGARPKFRVLIAEVAGLPAGYALFFDCYSSLRGHGIFLEDLFVLPQFRGKSVGRALLAHVARITRKTPTALGSCSMFSLGTMKRSSFTEE